MEINVITNTVDRSMKTLVFESGNAKIIEETWNKLETIELCETLFQAIVDTLGWSDEFYDLIGSYLDNDALEKLKNHL